jgi:hypothetical protein
VSHREIYVSRPRQQGHVTDHVDRPRKQGHVAQSDNDKCQVEIDISGTCKSRIRVTCDRHSAHATSSSDVRKLRHSGSFTLGVSPPADALSPEVPNVEVPKWTRVVRSEDHFGCILNH